MKLPITFCLVFWALIVFETLYPLGYFVSQWFGMFGTACGYMLFAVGVMAHFVAYAQMGTYKQ